MALSGIVNATKSAYQTIDDATGGFITRNNPLAGLLGFDRPANIADFKSNMATPAMTTQFDVLISLPAEVEAYIRRDVPQIAEELIGSQRAMRFKIEAAELPGRSIQTVEHKHYGPVRKVAYGSTYIDTTFTVVNSSDYRETRLFQYWQDYIIGRHRITGDTKPRDAGELFNTNYHNNYSSGSVIINAYDLINRKMKSVSLIEAYPLTVSPIQMNWSGDNIAKTQVTMTYRYTQDLTQYIADRTFAKALEKIKQFKDIVPKDGKASSFLKGQAITAGQIIPGAAKLL